jgi:hypothetical protein
MFASFSSIAGPAAAVPNCDALMLRGAASYPASGLTAYRPYATKATSTPIASAQTIGLVAAMVSE